MTNTSKSTKSLWDMLGKNIENSGISETNKNKLYSNLIKLKNKKVNMLITGATGSGKSSTINALFDAEVSRVGYGVDPETKTIDKYTLDNLIIWDSPGFGDSPSADAEHGRNIINKLNEADTDTEGYALIDIVLVIIDGSSKDMGTSYELINKVIIPNLSDHKRLLVAINQCDAALKGKGWDHKLNKPMPELEKFLEEKAASVRRRIKDSTGVDIEPVYYSALEKYNMSKLLNFIVSHTPEEKRFVYALNINADPEIWKDDDRRCDYNKDTSEKIIGSLLAGVTGAAVGAAAGAVLGSILPGVGTAIGAAAGAVIGGISSFIGSIFGR